MTALISSEKLRQKLQRNLNLKKYLEELSTLTGQPVKADELGSPEQAASMREVNQKFRSQPSRDVEIPFADKCSDRFKVFVHRLRDANPKSVYLWTPSTISCGALLIPSIEAVNFEFDFAINEGGILAFVTIDSEDRLLLDFLESPAGEQIMKVETQGKNWFGVSY